MTVRQSGPAHWAALVTVALSVSLTTGPVAGAQEVVTTSSPASANDAPSTVSYFTAVPCPPTVRTVALRAPRPHVAHRHRHPRVRAKHAVGPAHPAPHPGVVRHRHPHHHPHRIAAAAPVAPARCEVLHRDRFLRAGVDQAFGLGGDVAPADLAPIAAAAGPALFVGSPATSVFLRGGGGAPLGGGEGGGTALPSDYVAPSLSPPATVTAAPEPGTWMLLTIGVGLIGAALRQTRRRPVRASA